MQAIFNPSPFSARNNCGGEGYGWALFGEEKNCVDHQGWMGPAGEKVNCEKLGDYADRYQATGSAYETGLEVPSSGWPLVKKGSTGDAVIALQKLLQSEGYRPPMLIAVSVTGKFDAATDEAVRDFQKSKGLGVDGKVGRNTWGALGQKAQSSSRSSSPSTPTYDPASLATVAADQDEPFYKQSWFFPVALGAGLLFFGVPIVLLATR